MSRDVARSRPRFHLTSMAGKPSMAHSVSMTSSPDMDRVRQWTLFHPTDCMVAFLASEHATGITGQNYTVDGGLTMN